MGSSYFGEPNMGNDRGATGGSRRSRKNGSDKPKQPQRGLGVAQLEKIRLHGQMAGGTGGCSSYGQFHHGQYPSAPYPGSAFSQEDLRGQTGYSSIPSSSFSYNSSSPTSGSSSFGPNFMMGEDYERGSIRSSYGDNNNAHHSTNHASWGTSYGFLEMPQNIQPAMTRHLLNLQDPNAENHHRSSSLGSSHNSEMNEAQDLDLELRLSL